jgi:hypothetical protein
MPQAKKRPAVSKQKAMEWLKRSEQGESPPQIAVGDDVDVRMVRKYIKRAAQENEMSEARTMVYRNALEDHYRDFTTFLKKIDKSLGTGEPISPLSSKTVGKALRQHIPSSDIWAQIKDYDDSIECVHTGTESLRRWVTREAGAISIKGLQQGEETITDGICALLMIQAKHWLLGGKGLDLDHLLMYEPSDKPEYVNLKAGAYIVGKVKRVEGRQDRVNPEDILKHHSASSIIAQIKDLQARLLTSAAYTELAEYTSRLNKVKERLHESLETLTMKRVVAGHCKYCPF